jgi:hypothetical protein
MPIQVLHDLVFSLSRRLCGYRILLRSQRRYGLVRFTATAMLSDHLSLVQQAEAGD